MQTQEDQKGAALKLHREGRHSRHSLFGRTVSVGDELEAQTPSGKWIRGRYLWGQKLDRFPLLVLDPPRNSDRPRKMPIELDPERLCRWPVIAPARRPSRR